MFSPHERIYNTPDVSIPAAEAILQQLRLERVLKRFGYFACCKPFKTSGDSVAPPLVTLGPPAPTRTLRPFGAHEAFTGWQRSRNIQIPKPKLCKKNKPAVSGYPVNDSYLPQDRQTIGGCKYGGVHLSRFSHDTQRTDFFKPFQPLGSPQRLPALQRERNKKSTEACTEHKIQDADIHKQIEVTKNQRNTELKKLPVKVRKKKKKLEMEFMKWEANHDQYSTKSVSDLHEYVSSKETTHTNIGNEEKYREQIQTQVKRGVQQRVDSFGPSGKMFAKSTPQSDLIPVLELEFQHKNVRTNRGSMRLRK